MTRPTESIPGAGSARKVLDVLFCFSADRPVWTAFELSRQIAVSSATVYRYLALLRDVGLVDDDGAGSYRLSMRVKAFTAAAEAARSTLETLALPVMTRIRDSIDETVLLARRMGDSAIAVERVESLQPVRLQFDVGRRMMLHRGSIPRVLLAALPDHEREAYLDETFPHGRPHDLTPAALDAVVQAGYTQSFGEIDDGIWGAAAAIKVNGVTAAALGVAAPVYRLDAQQRERIIEVVRQGAEEIGTIASHGGRA